MRVLIIDDKPDLRQALRETLEELDGWEVEDQGFEAVEEALLRFRPDMVVLDLMRGEPPEGESTGNTSFDQIRETWFCPVVVYSAFPQQHGFDDPDFEHPLVTRIVKGGDSDIQVRNSLGQFVPDAEMIRSVHEDFDARVRGALRDSVHALRSQSGASDDGLEDSALRRAVRRLVAARVDIEGSGDYKLRAWERMVVPPLGDHLLTADLLRRREADWTDGDSFCLVLTPSCDLVGVGSRTPGVDRVLVARCEPLRKLGKITLSLGNPLSQNQRNSLQSMLTEGMVGERLVVPEFRGHSPHMAANLKRLELVDANKIDLRWKQDEGDADGPEFVRVASTDSPFRELVVWAYLRVTGRPGVPEIDVDGWLDDISEHLEAAG